MERTNERADEQSPFAYGCLRVVVARCSSLRMYIHVWKRYEAQSSGRCPFEKYPLRGASIFILPLFSFLPLLRVSFVNGRKILCILARVDFATLLFRSRWGQSLGVIQVGKTGTTETVCSLTRRRYFIPLQRNRKRRKFEGTRSLFCGKRNCENR